MIKGVEIGQYNLRNELSQGYREWFDEELYLSQNNSPKTIVYKQRIATQRITGVDERLRIVATIIDPITYFADSTNSLIVSETSEYSILYLLGLLNSLLFQWRFKLTSSNNNVGTNELQSMPFRRIKFIDSTDKARHDKMVALVKDMLRLQKSMEVLKNPVDKQMLQRQFETTDGQIDALVYELYGLTEEEIRIVEES
jgi:hypothetical protein